MTDGVKRYDISADVRGGADTDECATGDWVRYEDHVARLTALEQENKLWKRNMRETYEALVAMRNTLNEYVPMPSLESDLLSGPESSVFCSRVAQSVIAALTHEDKTCTCHPDDNPPSPCPRKYALSECRAAAIRSMGERG